MAKRTTKRTTSDNTRDDGATAPAGNRRTLLSMRLDEMGGHLGGYTSRDAFLDAALESPDPDQFIFQVAESAASEPQQDTAATVDSTESGERAAEEPRHVVEVEIKLPLGDLGSGYIARHVDVQLKSDAALGVNQGAALTRLRIGLQNSNLRTKNGCMIHSSADAVRWLLEQIPI